MSLVDRAVGVGGGASIGVGDCDRAEALAADDVRQVALGRVPLVVEGIIFIGIAVRPAVDDDRRDVARRIEPANFKRSIELVADMALKRLDRRAE